jgi:hypothetical protein
MPAVRNATRTIEQAALNSAVGLPVTIVSGIKITAEGMLNTTTTIKTKNETII